MTEHHHGHDVADDEDWPNTERVTLRSVGIDIGSSTAHVVVSTIVMERQGVHLSSRFTATERRVDARSPVTFTPYTDGGLIDADGIAAFVADAYQRMGVARDTIDTGAVIVTGEAARRANAERIVEAVADYAGDFVCATAGPVLEGTLAAHGSGAVARASLDRDSILNVDIGGGTTKLALVEPGRVAAVHAINVGGRLLAWDADRRLIRIEDAGEALAVAAGVEASLGSVLSADDARRVAATAADVILDAMAGRADHPLACRLAITEALRDHGIRRTMFTGGVGHLMQRTEADAGGYGDLGDLIATALADRVGENGRFIVLPARETLRATAIGVGQFTVQLSGNTISAADRLALPLRNVQVVGVRLDDIPDAGTVGTAIEQALVRGERSDGDGPVALALHVPPPGSPSAIAAIADGILGAFAATLASEHTLVVTVDQDIAGMLGQLLREERGTPDGVLVVDQVVVDDLDFLDVGRLRPDTGVIPVAVKSLVF